MIGFPLLGLAIGVVLVLVAAFCSAVFNRIAGGIIFALLATAFLDLKDSGRGVGLLLSLLLLKFRRVPFRESLGALNPELVQTDSPQLTVLLAVFELLKALFFFLLCFYGAKLWLVVILVGAFTVQGTLAMLPDSESGKPFLAISEENHKKIGIAAAVIYVLLMLAFVIAFAVSAVVGFFLVPYLKRIKAGQSIKENGPTWHMSKQGTPTMGGLMFIAAITIVCLSVGFECMAEGEYGHLFCLAFALVFGAIGFLDDYEKLKKKQNLGLTAGKKLLLQLAAAVAFIFLMRRFGYVALDSLYIPFWNKTVPISEPLYVIFAAFVIVGTVNSVNLTDGVDGLAASTTMPVCIFFAVISILWGERFLSLGVFASGIAGGLLGFLIYNFHPAKVFMGDTGSLFLGGAVAALAFAYDMPLILVTLGIMYIIEALSDIIQVGYFKLTHGKRVFKMSPFHHHLEMGGWTGHKWKETQIVALFAGVTVLFAVLSFIGVFHRFGV